MAHLHNLTDLKQVELDDAATATITPVAGVAGQEIRVFAIFFTLSVADTIQILSNTTTLCGTMNIDTSLLLDFQRASGDQCVPWFTTTAGEDLKITKGVAGTRISGRVYYTQA